MRGFSASNIKNMRQFFEQWTPVLNRQPMAGELENAENSEKSAKIPIFVLLDINRSPLANELDFSEFLELSFTHHMEILLKTSTLEERAFYIHQALINHWDKYALRDYLKADLYHHQGQLPNNFALTLPKTLHAQKAISMFKDEYLLDFVNVEELDKGADKSFVEYLLQDYNQPMGVATYKVMPEKLKAVMPDEKLLLEVM